jgi:hypothetical protein
VNPHLLKDLTARGLWTGEMKNQLIGAQGSVQGLDIPQELKDIYKTVVPPARSRSPHSALDRAAPYGSPPSIRA